MMSDDDIDDAFATNRVDIGRDTVHYRDTLSRAGHAHIGAPRRMPSEMPSPSPHRHAARRC